MKNLKRTIAIVCGGDSSEHDVSLRSAQGLYSFFDKERYDVYIVDVRGTDWRVQLPGGEEAKSTVTTFHSSRLTAPPSSSTMPISPSTDNLARTAPCRATST